MQTIVQMTHMGLEHKFDLKFFVRLNDTWVPIEQIGDPPYRLRVLQIIRADKTGWIALVESK